MPPGCVRKDIKATDRPGGMKRAVSHGGGSPGGFPVQEVKRQKEGSMGQWRKSDARATQDS